MNTCPHSVHSLRAVNSLLMVGVSNSPRSAAVGEVSLISAREATALATTYRGKVGVVWWVWLIGLPWEQSLKVAP